MLSFYSILVRLKEQAENIANQTRDGFYSILVRLKVGYTRDEVSKKTFLFHTGSIKSWITSYNNHPYIGFYSILVRLKA